MRTKSAYALHKPLIGIDDQWLLYLADMHFLQKYTYGYRLCLFVKLYFILWYWHKIDILTEGLHVSSYDLVTVLLDKTLRLLKEIVIRCFHTIPPIT